MKKELIFERKWVKEMNNKMKENLIKENNLNENEC